MAIFPSGCRFAGATLSTIASIAIIAAPVDARMSEGDCPTGAVSHPFAPWSDFADYTLAPDGDMEAGGDSWTLSNGAAMIDGNEPFYVGSPSDRASLRLPAASSAESAPMCIGREHPTLRLFAKRDRGSPAGFLLVEARFTDAFGTSGTVTIAAVTNAGAWAPTMPLPTVVNTLGLAEPLQVSFRFTPQGTGGWAIDDFYVDPYRTV